MLPQSTHFFIKEVNGKKILFADTDYINYCDDDLSGTKKYCFSLNVPLGEIRSCTKSVPMKYVIKDGRIDFINITFKEKYTDSIL